MKKYIKIIFQLFVINHLDFIYHLLTMFFSIRSKLWFRRSDKKVWFIDLKPGNPHPDSKNTARTSTNRSSECERDFESYTYFGLFAEVS